MSDIERAIVILKERYERKLSELEQDIPFYESSNNQELKIASRSLKVEAKELRIIVDALTKQISMRAYYEYDDEFNCPACNFEDDGYDITTLKVCPNCGQKLDWGESNESNNNMATMGDITCDRC